MNRRDFLNYFGCGVLSSSFPIQAFGKVPNNHKFVIVILRGALDGLAAFPAFGDPYLKKLRSDLINEDDYSILDSSFFGIHNKLENTKKLFESGDLSLFHAISMPDVTRSHFEDQDMLEFSNKSSDTGWIGRSLEFTSSFAISVGSTLPKILWGSKLSSTWTPKNNNGAPDAYYDAAFLLSESDPELHDVISEAYEIKIISEGSSSNGEASVNTGNINSSVIGLSNLMLYRNGKLDVESTPDVGVLSLGGWDTHNRQIERINNPLKNLDITLGLLQREFSPIWNNTTVLVVTEFGRTVKSNGAGGTDHGFGSVALLMGGGVSGGKIYADWEGLKNLNENRELKSTMDLQDIFATISHHILNVPQSKLLNVFPLKNNIKLYDLFI